MLRRIIYLIRPVAILSAMIGYLAVPCRVRWRRCRVVRTGPRDVRGRRDRQPQGMPRVRARRRPLRLQGVHRQPGGSRSTATEIRTRGNWVIHGWINICTRWLIIVRTGAANEACKLIVMRIEWVVWLSLVSWVCSGLVHIVVPGRVQLRHSEEDQRAKPKHRGPGFHGSSVCRQGERVCLTCSREMYVYRRCVYLDRRPVAV